MASRRPAPCPAPTLDLHLHAVRAATQEIHHLLRSFALVAQILGGRVELCSQPRVLPVELLEPVFIPAATHARGRLLERDMVRPHVSSFAIFERSLTDRLPRSA